VTLWLIHRHEPVCSDAKQFCFSLCIVIRAQSTLGGKTFLPKNIGFEKLTNCLNLSWHLPENCLNLTQLLPSPTKFFFRIFFGGVPASLSLSLTPIFTYMKAWRHIEICFDNLWMTVVSSTKVTVNQGLCWAQRRSSRVGRVDKDQRDSSACASEFVTNFDCMHI